MLLPKYVGVYVKMLEWLWSRDAGVMLSQRRVCDPVAWFTNYNRKINFTGAPFNNLIKQTEKAQNSLVSHATMTVKQGFGVPCR